METAGFNRWMEEYLKIYSLSWLLRRVTLVLGETRKDINLESTRYNLNLSLMDVMKSG